MGNPAGVRKMKKEKRRAKFEKRLGATAYVPKEFQEEIKKAVAEIEAEEKKAKALRVAKGKEKQAERAKAKAEKAAGTAPEQPAKK